MIQLLSRLWIKENTPPEKVRQIYGMLCGTIGIILNLLLSAGKFLAGTLSNSIAIVADAINNLSDAGSSLVTLVGFKLAGQKPDEKHPYGHGRIEYISGLIVAAVILLMAYELIRDSIMKIVHAEQTECSVLTLVILLVSIGVKLYMVYYNRRIGEQIASTAMKATAADSLSDVIATTVVLISSIVGQVTALQIDGYCGVLVGLFILRAGAAAAKETLSPLLGEKPDEEFVQNITDIVLSHKAVRGMHDLMVHDYGPGRRMISLHAEVSAEEDILTIHEVIDHIEHELWQKLGCETTIHMDPIVTSDAHVKELRESVIRILLEFDETLSMHDFRVVRRASHTNLIFDVVVSFHYRMTDEELVKKLREQISQKLGRQYHTIIRVDKS